MIWSTSSSLDMIICLSFTNNQLFHSITKSCDNAKNMFYIFAKQLLSTMWNGNCWCCWGSKHRSPCNWQPRYPSSYMTILNLEWPWKPPSDAHPCPSDIQVVRWVLQLRNKPPEIRVVLITLNLFITLGRSFSFLKNLQSSELNHFTQS